MSQPTESHGSPKPAERGERPRVLVVDDDLAVARSYARTLAGAGYAVETAGDGEAARALLGRSTFDVIVSDVRLPGIDGIEVLRAARERDPDVAVVVVAGSPREEDAAAAVGHGALVYLVKPLELATLTQVVANGARLTRIARLRRAALEEASGPRIVSDRADLEVAFERALASLEMAYQPIVRWPSRSVHAYEALLRSRDPALSSAPAVLDAAERLGELATLGRRVRAAVAQAVPALPDGARMFVNVHPSELDDDDLFSADAPLSRHASHVVLEITERASLDTLADVPGRIAALRDLGYGIALDDFGEGYAGLASLVKLAPDVVKLDMSMVRSIHVDLVKQKLVSAMMALCTDTGVAVVGEGVETIEERDTLAELGCRLHQGYLFARPGAAFPTVAW